MKRFLIWILILPFCFSGEVVGKEKNIEALINYQNFLATNLAKLNEMYSTQYKEYYDFSVGGVSDNNSVYGLFDRRLAGTIVKNLAINVVA